MWGTGANGVGWNGIGAGWKKGGWHPCEAILCRQYLCLLYIEGNGVWVLWVEGFELGSASFQCTIFPFCGVALGAERFWFFCLFVAFIWIIGGILGLYKAACFLPHPLWMSLLFSDGLCHFFFVLVFEQGLSFLERLQTLSCSLCWDFLLICILGMKWFYHLVSFLLLFSNGFFQIN